MISESSRDTGCRRSDVEFSWPLWERPGLGQHVTHLDADEGILDAAAQPHCPECGAVLHDIPGGFFCPADGLTFLSGQS
ncbi:hypothetical protein GCM10027411_19200 [Microbacterium aureliae]